MVSKNIKKTLAFAVFVVIILALVLGLYFGLDNANKNHTTPRKLSRELFLSSLGNTNKIVVYGDAFLISDASVQREPICEKNNFSTFKISYKTRYIISYKENTNFPRGNIYLSNKGTIWFNYNPSTGLFELYSGGKQIMQFIGQILGIATYQYLFVYLPFSQLPADIKSLIDYDLTYDYYTLVVDRGRVILGGLGNVNVMKNQLCMKGVTPPTFELTMNNPTSNQ